MRRFVVPLLVCTLGFALIASAWYIFFAKTTDTADDPAADIENSAAAPGFARAIDTQAAPPGPLLPPRTPPLGFKEYRSETHRFSVFYPETLTVESFDEGAGASTIVLQDPEAGQGFQVFVVPYSGVQVSTERFRRDAPSGIMQDPHDLEIDSALATMFFGKDPLLGETREVWFIHGGYLFEVSAPKVLDEWLGTIMSSWRFI